MSYPLNTFKCFKIRNGCLVIFWEILSSFSKAFEVFFMLGFVLRFYNIMTNVFSFSCNFFFKKSYNYKNNYLSLLLI